MSNTQYALFDGTNGYTGSATYDSTRDLYNFQGPYVAVGLFTGSDGLPPDGSYIGDVTSFNAYVDALTAKQTEISSGSFDFLFFNVSQRFVGVGGNGDDTFTADASDSGTGLLMGRDGDDSLVGGAGNDTLAPGAGNDTIVGGGGNNTVSFADVTSFTDQTQGVVLSLGHNGDGLSHVDGAGFVRIDGIQDIIGSTRGDFFLGDANDNVIDGGGGDDSLEGGDGSDTLSFASAKLGVYGSMDAIARGYETNVGYVIAVEFENILGSAFDDTLIGTSGDNVINGNGGDDSLDGHGGDDTVSYAGAANSVSVSLARQGLSQDTGVGTQYLANFTNLTGSDHADALGGDSNANVVSGGGGADTVDGYGGDDSLIGGGGSDTVSYASNNLNGTQGVTVSLALQGSAQTTGVGSQVLSGFENLTGSYLSDRLTGDANANVIDSGSGGGQDTIFGGGGDDTLIAVSTAGQIYGQAGDDHLVSNGHALYMDGGAGADVYDFQDLIADHNRAATLGEIGSGDVVALDGAATANGLQHFTAVDRFTGEAGQIVAGYHAGSDRTVYKIDIDGDGKTDARIIAKDGHYDFSQFTGVDTSHLSAVAPHDALVV